LVASSGQAPLITVVIATLDRPRTLERCLAALAEATRKPAAVVVVDQGTESAEGAVARARQRGLPVRRIAQSRWGLSASQNAGVAEASTDVVAITDDDCVPDADWLAVIERSFTEAPGPLLLTGRVLPLPVDGDRVAAVSTRDSIERHQWTTPPMPWHVGTGGNFAVTRLAYEAVGGNDERLGTGAPGRGANDLDLFHRLVASGVTARYEPDLVVRHDRSSVADYVARRRTYGYGVGAMLGLWLRERNLHGLVVLLGWLRLRSKLAVQRRAHGGVQNEARVLMGTAAGLRYGITCTSDRRPQRG
jgi:GT2 family glycosyltransferase